VCDDTVDHTNLLNVGTVVCRSLGARLIDINTEATGPTHSMYIYTYIYYDNTWCKVTSNSFYIYSEYFHFL